MFGIAGFPGDLLAGNKNIDHQVLRSKLTHETHRNTTQAVGVRYVWYLIMNIMGRFFLKLQGIIIVIASQKSAPLCS